MTAPKAEDIKRGIAVIWENLQCPICLDLMNAPVSTRCDHQFCKFCLMKLLERSKKKETSCPVCKMNVTKRSLKESPGFQRLVEGLQNLVQSYEFDTCTSYFTGIPQSRKETSVETESRDQQCSEENGSSGNDVTDKSASHFSSAAVKDAFAELMGLVDSCTVNSEQDCFDSGLGGPVNKADELQDVPSRIEDRQSNSPIPDSSGSDGKTDLHKRRSSRRPKRVGLEPDRIADKRQKKSVEKVAEWLLKISPSSDTQTRYRSRDPSVPADSDSEKESVCSSSPTEAYPKDGDEDDVNPPKEVRGRCLEEKVFGAVYKRERKGGKTKVNRPVSPEKETVANPVPFNLVQEEEMMTRHGLKRKRSCRLTPADFIKKSSSDGREAEVKEPVDSVTHNAVEENKQVELNTEEQIEILGECDKIAELSADAKCDNTVKNMEESPAIEVPLKRSGRRSKSKMQDIWQNVDLDLKEKENICDNRTSRKRRSNRSSCELTKDGHLDESKNAKCTKSLTLVDAAANNVDVMEQLKNKPKIVEAEINIESYPSSADPRSPDARKTRRSLRLQAFTTEIQGTLKQRRTTKPSSGPETHPLDNPSHFNCLDQPNVDKVNANEENVDADQGIGSTQQSRSGKTDLLIMKNGCVFNSSLGTIEAVRTNEETAISPCVSEGQGPEQNSVLSIIPDTVAQDGPSLPCSSVAASSAFPLQAVTLDSSLPEKSQTSPSAGFVAPSVVQTLRDAHCERGGIEVEGETNDSELDTELLMKSFKASKRKSFHLGSPKPSPKTVQERLLTRTDEEQKLQYQIPTTCKDDELTSDLATICHNDLPPSSNASKLPLCEESSQRSQSSFGNAAVASLIQANASVATGDQKEAFLKNSGNSTCSGLSPNRVARSSQDSKLPTNSDSAASYQGFFPKVTSEESSICSSSEVQKNELQKSPKLGTCQPRIAEMSNKVEGSDVQTKHSSDSNKSPNIAAAGSPNLGAHSNQFESSITPDGLIPKGPVPYECQVTEPASNHSLNEENDAGSQPCVPRKRRAQRLKSSESELSVEDDSLPTLAHIFKSHRLPSHSGQEPNQTSEISELDNQEPDPGYQSPADQEPDPGYQSPADQEPDPGYQSPADQEPDPGYQSPADQEPDPGFQSPADQANKSNEATPEAQSQNQECPENANATADDYHLPQPSCREEWVTSSQGSVDLFGTPEESEAVGICGNVAVSRDSSQYSSEIITTQKEEMQQELCRLERMMALVSEALQKKEKDTSAKTQNKALNPTHSELQSAADPDQAEPCSPALPADRQSGLDSDGDHSGVSPGPAAPDGLCAPESQPLLTTDQAKTGRRVSRSRQKSQGRGRKSSQKAEAGLSLRNHNTTSEGSVTELTKGNEAKEAQKQTRGADMRRLGSSSTAGKMELVASGLSASELMLVKKFARKMHGHLSKEMTPGTTHVIIKTDEDLVCERTLKYFQGIAGRKWVVSFLWISECFNQGQVLDEAQFEVRGDVVNGHNHNGPLKSRTTSDGLLMKGYEICFQGSFTAMTTDQMEAMVEMCGATVVKDPLMFSKHIESKCQLVVVQPGSDDSQTYYRALQKKATVVSRSWLLDTISTYSLQNPQDHKP
ncbi:breast cancer type 1 susceptibility protein homolog isoform X2 [Astyanax mexicanus]|uniref:breast cancer type 1 susceptibility protein homolog isoform X2 n=1 Tax=Astyanax mexicanus TaxID=7994 RepID=UPI0020CB595B|nr:breast cancer type 1 susceptibility protein homolog isoform X2 [Astyanax mexicanus]